MDKEIVFSREKAIEVIFENLFPAYFSHSQLFKYVHAGNGDAIQNNYIPEGVERGSLEHQIFLYFTNLMTYRNSSEVGFRQCVTLYEKYPFLFSEAILEIENEDVAEKLKESGNVHPNENAKRWKGSGMALFGHYDGNPVAIFEDIRSIDELMKKKRRKEKNIFPGLGPKLASLLALFYEELNLVPHIEGAFPVDVHIQAQCIGTKVAIFSGDINSTDLAEILRRRISDICYERNVSPLDLSHAMWFLGNKLCVACRRKKGTSELLCPIFKYCSGRPSTRKYRLKGKWGNIRERRMLPLFKES